MKYISVVILTCVSACSVVFWYVYPVPKDFLYYILNFSAAAVLITIYLALGIKMLKLMKLDGGRMKYPFAFALSICVMGTLIFIAGAFGLYNIYFAYGTMASPCRPLLWGNKRGASGRKRPHIGRGRNKDARLARLFLRRGRFYVHILFFRLPDAPGLL